MNRIAWIDWSKSFCIFLMVIGHTWMCPALPLKYIYSFHMPMLFIVSGYLIKETPVLKLLLSFSIPIILFSAINLCYEWTTTSPADFNLRSLIGYSNNSGYGYLVGVWYVEVLFCAKILFNIGLVKKFHRIISMGLIILLSIISSFYSFESTWYIERIIPSFPFISLGVYLREHNKIIDQIKTRIVIFLIIISLLVVSYNNSCDLHCGIYGYNYLLFYLGAIGLSLCFIKVFSLLKNNDFVQTISSGTFLILGLHMTLFYILLPIMPGKVYDQCYYIIPTLILLICYPLIKFCQRFCPCVLGRIKIGGTCRPCSQDR